METNYHGYNDKKGSSIQALSSSLLNLAPNRFDILKLQPRSQGLLRFQDGESNTIDLRTRLWGINPTNTVVIPQSLVLRSTVLG